MSSGKAHDDRVVDLREGAGLVFVLGGFRSGTTLLRKVLDSHSRIYSPAETWFLLPLLNLWEGKGTGEGYQPGQAATALRGQVDRAGFVECCRAFAGAFYERARPSGATGVSVFVDKTPLYLSIAGMLPEVFPRAKFLTLAREPRALLWSRLTWQHNQGKAADDLRAGVIRDVGQLAGFRRENRERSHLVSYERLCESPEAEVEHICDFLEVSFEPGMIAYGENQHHEGYGDEKSREHGSPHVEGIARWKGAEGLTPAFQKRLLAECGEGNLEELGYDLVIEEPSETIEEACIEQGLKRASSTDKPGLSVPPNPIPNLTLTQPTRPRISSQRRVMFFMQPGNVSREIFLDMAEGFRRAECEVLIWELQPVWARQQRARERGRITEAMQETAEEVRWLIESNDIDLSIGMWANSLLCLSHGERNGEVVSFFDLVESPHLLFWLDAPHWAHQGAFQQQFKSSLLRSRWCFNMINNPGTGSDMANVLGFSNVLPQPYGVNEAIFRPYEGAKEYDLVFGLGPGDASPTPLMRKELEAERPDHEAIRRDEAERVRGRFEELVQPFAKEHRAGIKKVLSHLVELQLAARHTAAYDRLCSLTIHDPGLKGACEQLVAQPQVYVKAMDAVRSIEQWERAFTISYLSRHFSCAVFGEPTLEGWGCRAEMMGRVGHEEQAKSYSRGRVGLNVMRWQDDLGCNVKPFEIAASGTACLMGKRAGVEACFVPDREIVLFDSPGEARDKMDELLGDEGRREAIAGAGRARVVRDHTWTARARAIMELIGESTGRWDTAGGQTDDSFPSLAQAA